MDAIVFVDGQNLFHSIKREFGYTQPNFDVLKLSTFICKKENWTLKKIYFYTGIPTINGNRHWHIFWMNKLRVMGRKGIKTYSRSLRYQNEIGIEKGIDVRIALDAFESAIKKESDVILIFSQDQDFSELVKKIKNVALEQKRVIVVSSAFPCSGKHAGIHDTKKIPFDKNEYDQCIDPMDYREKKARK